MHYIKFECLSPAKQLLPPAELFIKVIQNSYECQNSLFFKLSNYECLPPSSGSRTHIPKFKGLNPAATSTHRTFLLLFRNIYPEFFRLSKFIACADQHKCVGGKTHYTKGLNPTQQLLPPAERFLKLSKILSNVKIHSFSNYQTIMFAT